jgi:hypothetical protein
MRHRPRAIAIPALVITILLGACNDARDPRGPVAAISGPALAAHTEPAQLPPRREPPTTPHVVQTPAPAAPPAAPSPAPPTCPPGTAPGSVTAPGQCLPVPPPPPGTPMPIDGACPKGWAIVNTVPYCVPVR